jgi:hypothetical protein
MNFQLDDVLQSGDFVQLFDRYKIVGVKLKFTYQCSIGGDQANWQSAGPLSQVLPIIDFTYDADDANPPTTRALIQVKAYAKQRILQANQTFSMYYKPRVTKTVYNGGPPNPVAYTTEKPCWLDCANPDVQHYGFKAWISSWPYSSTAPTSTNGVLTIQPVYYIMCRDTQ